MLSIWEKESFYKPVDVIIIGSGLMGLWTAYELKERTPDLDILILERSSIPTGASTRNAGFACFGSVTELLHNAEIMGAEEMLKTVQARYKGMQKIRRVLGDEKVGFEDCGGHECINSDYKHYSQLADKVKWLNDLLEPITKDKHSFILNNKKLATTGLTDFDALIETRYEGALHSGKLVQSLMQLAVEKGVQIMTGQAVANWEQTAINIRVYCQQHCFDTKKLLIATNGFTTQLLPAAKVEPARGQVIVTKPIDGLKLFGTFHFDEGFYYWRHLGNRVLLGGARNLAINEERTQTLETSIAIQKELERFLLTHILKDYALDPINLIEYRWAGLMGFTEDRKPQVIQVDKNIWSAICCNGMGVALAPIVAEEVAIAMLQ